MTRDPATAVGVRVQRRRTGLDDRSAEWDGRSEISADLDQLLVVDALPRASRDATATLRRWRQTLAPGAEVYLIEPTRAIRSESAVSRGVSRLRSRVGERQRGAPTLDRDTVLAIRDAGWTITSIERFVDENGNWWIDSRLVDVAAIVAAEAGETGND